MTLSRLLAFLVALALFPAAAQAHTTIIEPVGSHFPYQQWVDEARVPTPEMVIVVIEGDDACLEQNGGCTAPDEGAIWVEPSRIVGRRPRAMFLHELGHNEDHAVLPAWMRERYQKIMGLTGAWFQPEAGWFSPNEWFAETWAECAVKPHLPERATLGIGPIFGQEPMGGPAAHNAACRMLAKL